MDEQGFRLPDNAADLVEAVRENRRQRRILEAQELQMVAHFVDLNGHVDQNLLVPGVEQLVQLGGEGTPPVAEFATLELAAALRLRDVDAHALIADVLDLRHRLPRVWEQALDGEVEVWTARDIAGATRVLDQHSAGLVDLQLARQIPGMTRRRVKNLVAGIVLDHLPVDEAEQRRQEATEARGAWIAVAENGIADVAAVMDAPDAVRLDATLNHLAGILQASGSPDTLNARRAKALGILADPARALQLMQACLLDQLPGLDVTTDCHLHGQVGHACGTLLVDAKDLAPKASIVVHLTDATLSAGEGIVRAKGIGPLLAEWLRDLLPDHQFTVRPVIDANRQVASDCYECPPTMREAIEYRNPFEVFPYSSRKSPGLDLDHTIPFTPRQARGTSAEPVEASGSTSPDNLGPLTRKTHRAKTHGGYRLEQPLPGHFLWQTPLGFRYLVTPSRTLELGRPDPVGLTSPGVERH